MGYGAPEQAMNAEIQRLRIELDLLKKQVAEMRKELNQHYSNHVTASNSALDQARLDTY
jgi:hypothetical protein